MHKWPATTTTVEMVASARDDEPMDWRLRLQPSGIIIRKNPGPGLRDVRYPQRSGEDWSSLGCWICSCYRQLTERTDPPAGCATSQSQGVGWPSEIKGEVAMGGVIEGRVSTRRGAGAATGWIDAAPPDSYYHHYYYYHYPVLLLSPFLYQRSLLTLHPSIYPSFLPSFLAIDHHPVPSPRRRRCSSMMTVLLLLLWPTAVIRSSVVLCSLRCIGLKEKRKKKSVSSSFVWKLRAWHSLPRQPPTLHHRLPPPAQNVPFSSPPHHPAT